MLPTVYIIKLGEQYVKDSVTLTPKQNSAWEFNTYLCALNYYEMHYANLECEIVKIFKF